MIDITSTTENVVGFLVLNVHCSSFGSSASMSRYMHAHLYSYREDFQQ